MRTVKASHSQSPPPSGFLKFNFDGSRKPSTSGIGGIIRDSSSSCILSFSHPLGHCSVDEVELIALRMGLPELSKLDANNIIVEGNSWCTTRWAASRTKCCIIWRMLLKKCLSWLPSSLVLFFFFWLPFSVASQYIPVYAGWFF